MFFVSFLWDPLPSHLPISHCSRAEYSIPRGPVSLAWKQRFMCTHKHMHLHMFEYLSILKRDLDTHTDMYTCLAGMGQCMVGHCRCESLYPAINRCHLTVQSTRGLSGAAGMVTRAGHYWARRQPIASAINDKGWRRGQKKWWRSRGGEM